MGTAGEIAEPARRHRIDRAGVVDCGAVGSRVKAADYRRRASECLLLAKQASPEARIALLKMAAAWLTLTERAQKREAAHATDGMPPEPPSRAGES
jgi:hypothetical protein